MTDKRSESERVTARPPLPSIAPPTDEIDSEWGADDVPAPARLPELTAAATPTPAPRPSSIPAPAAHASVAPAAHASVAPAAHASVAPATHASVAPAAHASTTPVPRASAPPRPSSPAAAPRPASAPPSATSTPAPKADNPLRKQTLLGIAPIIPARSEPPKAASPAPSSPPAADNPLRKRTLLGIAPVIPADPRAPSTPPAALTSALAEPRAPLRAFSDDSDDDELPELRSARSRWVLPLGAAAVLVLGVIALRRLDHEPPATPASAKAPPVAAKAAPLAQPLADDDSAPDTELEPGEPEPAEATPSPDAARAAPAAAAPGGAPSASAPGGPSADPMPPRGASPGAALTPGMVRVSMDSDPEGARLFWRGKEMGTTPFVLELAVGERRSFELVRPGFVTRKVVIDGSKTEVSIGLRQDPTATAPASPRKQ
jgi:hypothetical protein